MTGRADDSRQADASRSRAIEAVLLDIDGTLLDSNDAHAQSWSDTFKESGLEIGSETVRPLIGMGADKLLPKLTGFQSESEQGQRLVRRRREIFQKVYLPFVRPFPNATDLLQRMRADGLRLVVATSASDEELRGLLDALGAPWLVDEKTSSSDAERSKPDPDIVHVALEKAGAAPDRCVMLGDSPYDVEAAQRARVSVVAVRCGGWGDGELAGAAEIYDDPAAILSNYAQTLIGRGAAALGSRTARTGDVAAGTSERRGPGSEGHGTV